MPPKLALSILKNLPLLLLAWPFAANAKTPLGWINTSNSAAYTIGPGEFELSIGGLAVNSRLDFLDFRDDLLAGNQTLVGDSGDLQGNKIEIHLGIIENVALYFKQQTHSLTVDLGTINSVTLVDIDDSIDTSQQSAGLKWTFFEGHLLNPDNRQSAASLEISAYSNKSADFDVKVSDIRFDNFEIIFRDPQTFSVADLEDDGWKSKVMYTFPIQQKLLGTLWAGYGRSKASSATTSDIASETFSRLFEQAFTQEESYTYLGASLNIAFTARWRADLSYEFTQIQDADFTRDPVEPAINLPGFLNSTGPSAENINHTVNGQISYWLTPHLNLSLTGKLYSNQFLGVIPHYNNPLSGSFSSTPYGFLGLELGYKF